MISINVISCNDHQNTLTKPILLLLSILTELLIRCLLISALLSINPSIYYLWFIISYIFHVNNSQINPNSKYPLINPSYNFSALYLYWWWDSSKSTITSFSINLLSPLSSIIFYHSNYILKIHFYLFTQFLFSIDSFICSLLILLFIQSIDSFIDSLLIFLFVLYRFFYLFNLSIYISNSLILNSFKQIVFISLNIND